MLLLSRVEITSDISFGKFIVAVKVDNPDFTSNFITEQAYLFFDFKSQ